MENEKKGFTGIWIPKVIWENEELGWTEKLLLVEIEALDNEKGCYAKNEYFSNFFGLSKDRISKLITNLKRMGYIEVELFYKKGTKQIENRKINVNTLKYHGKEGRRKNLEGIGENNDTPIGENAIDNNIINNNKNNNTIESVEETLKNTPNIPSYRMLSAKRKSAINARVTEYGLPEVLAAIESIALSDFFRDSYNSKANWYNIDWIFNPNNFLKIVEGKYVNKKQIQQQVVSQPSAQKIFDPSQLFAD